MDIPEGFTGLDEIEIPTPDGTIRFMGELIDVVDNERRGRPRWAEIELYRYVITDPRSPECGAKRYLLHTMGHSVIYHRHESACNKGISVPVEEFETRAEFPDDLEPCRDVVSRGRVISRGCYPEDWQTAEEGTMFDLEVVRHTNFFCPTPEAVMEQLRRAARKTCTGCDGRRTMNGEPCPVCEGRGYLYGERELSAPGQRLVEMARARDEGIAKAADRTVML